MLWTIFNMFQFDTRNKLGRHDVSGYISCRKSYQARFCSYCGEDTLIASESLKSNLLWRVVYLFYETNPCRGDKAQ